MHAMHRIPKLLILSPRGVVCTRIHIVRRMPIRPPKPLESAGLRVKHDDSPVHVAIRDVQLMSLGVYFYPRRPSQDVCPQAIRGIGRRMPALLQEVSVSREL